MESNDLVKHQQRARVIVIIGAALSAGIWFWSRPPEQAMSSYVIAVLLLLAAVVAWCYHYSTGS